MNKLELINQLNERLSGLPREEAERFITFYSESIDDRMEEGMTEQQAIDDLGGLDAIVETIEREQERLAPAQPAVNKDHKTLWIVLAICGFPLWLPVAAAVASVVLVLYLVGWCMILSIFAALLSLVLCGAAAVVVGAIRCVTGAPLAGVMLVGMGVAALGVFILAVFPMAVVAKQYARFTVFLVKKAFRGTSAKKEVE